MQPPLAPATPEWRAIRAVQRHAIEGKLPADAASLGLDRNECDALLEQVGIENLCVAKSSRPAALAPAAYLDQLVAFIWAHRCSADPVARLMAGTVASACFGARHLWQDIGLQGRPEVTAILTRHFPQLAAGNTRDLKWKRYLFLRLGDELGLQDLRPPRCDGCEDFDLCYGPSSVFGGATIRSVG